MRPGSERERAVVGRHHEILPCRLAPKERGREMDRIESSERGGHRLRGAVEDHGIEVHDLERVDESKNERAPRGNFRIGERLL